MKNPTNPDSQTNRGHAAGGGNSSAYESRFQSKREHPNQEASAKSSRPAFIDAIFFGEHRSSSTPHDFVRDLAACGVSRIHHKPGFLHDAGIVVGSMIGENQNAIITVKVIKRLGLHIQVVSPAPP